MQIEIPLGGETKTLHLDLPHENVTVGGGETL